MIVDVTTEQFFKIKGAPETPFFYTEEETVVTLVFPGEGYTLRAFELVPLSMEEYLLWKDQFLKTGIRVIKFTYTRPLKVEIHGDND